MISLLGGEMKHNLLNLFMVLMLLLAGTSGCKKDSNPATVTDMGSITEDAAESISGAVGDDNGGATNQLGELMQLSSQNIGSAAVMLAKTNGATTVGATYNPSTGWWTITVDTSVTGILRSASFKRVYQIRYLKNAGDTTSFISNRTVGLNVATAVQFVILNGSGSAKTLRLNHQLQSVTGAFLTTGINTDTVTINSTQPYIRVGSDSITTRNASRMLTHTLTMNFLNIKSLRFKTIASRSQFATAFSGTITGNITANIQVIKNSLYSERSINKDFSITINGGQGTIILNGKTFTCKIKEGEMN